jgi:hypothetical protein
MGKGEGRSMNVELLRKIQKHILEEPKRIYMPRWRLVFSAIRKEGLCAPECGTVGCIGGWAEILSGVEGYARDLLGLDSEHGEASRLFNDDEWPEKFQTGLRKANPQTQAYAQVVSDRIDHFISTRGEE